MRKILLAVVIIAALGIGLAYAMPTNVKCPVNGWPMEWTGKTTYISSIMFYEFRCVEGHTTLVRD